MRRGETPLDSKPCSSSCSRDGGLVGRFALGKGMRKGEIYPENSMDVKKYQVCSSPEGENPERGPNSGQLCQRFQCRGQKQYFPPEK